MDVVTTSGVGTGEAAREEEIRPLKAAIGEFPLAIARGVTPENVARYLPCAEAFQVATGISRNFSELDPDLVEDLIRRVRAFES